MYIVRGHWDHDETAGAGVNDKLDLIIEKELINHGTSDDYYTPPFIFEALGLEFDLDVSAPPGGVPWIPAKNFYTIIDDGLSQEWNGKIWCNPPYSNTTPWLEKMIEHNNGIALVQIAKSAWCNLVWKKADGVLFMPTDLKFVRNSGKSLAIFTHTMLVGFGADNVEAMRQSNLGFVR